MANKKFETPEIKFFEVKLTNVVATSGGGTGGSGQQPGGRGAAWRPDSEGEY